ncbi:ATP-binding cassette domain-containing protein [Actinocatenispora sera]|uniref:ATP-binding cassette domain-containing protein n=1 Tax=Actinocatenispora sera TaxID=390989 RepID=UPI0033CA807B
MCPDLELTDLELAPTATGGVPGRAVDGLRCAVAPGQVVAVIGETGFGGTRLARAVVGLDEPAGGRITFGEHQWSADEAPCAFVPSGGGLIPQLSLRRNMLFGARLREEIRAREESTAGWLERRRIRWRRYGQDSDQVDRMLTAFQLSSVERYVPDRVSAAQRMLTALGRALLHGRPVLVVDATGGQEPDDAYVQLLDQARTQRPDLAVLLCTDRPGLLRARTDPYAIDWVVVVGYQGTVVAQGPPAAVARPGSVDSAAVLYGDPMLIVPVDDWPTEWGAPAPAPTPGADWMVVGAPAASTTGTARRARGSQLVVEVLGPHERPRFQRVRAVRGGRRDWLLRLPQPVPVGHRVRVTATPGRAVRVPLNAAAPSAPVPPDAGVPS